MRGKTFLLFALALGLAVSAGCGGNGGGSDVPRSSPSYLGSSLPAVLDSSTGTQNLGYNFLWDVNQLAGQSGGGMKAASLGATSSNTSDYGEGGDGGSYTYAGSSSSRWDETSWSSSVVQTLSFSDFADSGGVYINYVEGPGGIDRAAASGQGASLLAVPSEQGAAPLAVRSAIQYSELQAGRGSMYRSSSSRLTSDGTPTTDPTGLPLLAGPGVNGLVGRILTEHSAYHSNYESYFTSEGYPDNGYDAYQRQVHQSGFASASMSAAFDSTLLVWSFDDTFSANYARGYYYSYDDIYQEPSSIRFTQALLNFKQNHAWDLSTATLTSSGTYCGEGEVESYIYGCVAFNVSLSWDNDASDDPSYCRGTGNPISCYGWPEDGLITLEAGDATASYAFTPSGGTFIFDAGDGSAVFQTNLPPFIM